MDAKLLAWARAVKSRDRLRHFPPPLWLFTDAARHPDPLPAIAALPRGLAGIVLRHDGAPGRAALARAVARLARARRLALVVAGDARLAAAIGAGVHLREGRWPGPAQPSLRKGALVTSSAHGLADLARARRAGAGLVFLSPAFATASHPGAPPLGPVRWARLARLGLPTAALGGISSATVKRLGRACRAAAAITALTPGKAVAQDHCGSGITVFQDCHGDPVPAIATTRQRRHYPLDGSNASRRREQRPDCWPALLALPGGLHA